MVRINRVYTKAGDGGTTALIGGDKVPKDNSRITAYGTVDELNACIGLALASIVKGGAASDLGGILPRVQNELFNLGSILATPDAEQRAKMPPIEERHVAALETEMDRLNEDLPELRSFVLPGGGESSARLHLARTVCRRAERLVVSLHREGGDCAMPIRYLNRLSDALFVFGRHAAKAEGQDEALWTPEST